MKPALNHCPFCGGKATYSKIEDGISARYGDEFIICTNSECRASTQMMFSPTEDVKPLLAAVWNRRVITEPIIHEPAVQPEFDSWLNDHFKIGFGSIPATEIIARAKDENIRLCIGKGHRDHEARNGHDWTMSIPLQNEDSDVIFDYLASFAEMLLERLRKEIFCAKQ